MNVSACGTHRQAYMERNREKRTIATRNTKIHKKQKRTSKADPAGRLKKEAGS